MEEPDDRSGALTRRRFIAGTTAVAAGGLASGVFEEAARAAATQGPAAVALGVQPPGLPAAQFAWDATLARDQYGNPIAPRHDRLLFFDVRGTATPAHARVLEAALRTLERTYRWGPAGLLFTAGWGTTYFEHVLRTASPVPAARALSDFELPAIDRYHLCLHLASDEALRLAAIEAALVHGAPLSGAHGQLDVSSALVWRETRTGFAGAGLPARNQHVGGIPAGDPVPASAPLYMGFKSGLLRNQASEDAITIGAGPFAGGTTQQVSYMRLRLDSWYGGLSDSGRVARMYAPQVSPEQAARFTTDAAGDPDKFAEAVTRYGVVGHAQASARARRANKPLILRRDFDTSDGGQAGLHFVSLQRTIEDFITTRSAMNASTAPFQNPAITDTVNNGINEFVFVLRRANYLVPARTDRSFPQLAGRAAALRQSPPAPPPFRRLRDAARRSPS
jgi:hypothetical protein